MKKLCFMLISMLIGTATTMAQIEPLIDAPAPESELMLIGYFLQLMKIMSTL